MYLGVGLLSLSENDAQGSRLASAVGAIYNKITGAHMNIKTFLNTYKLEIVLPPIERFNTEQLLELQSYAISLLDKAA